MSRYSVPNNLLNALIQQESGGNPNAISRVGARGLGQAMPETARNPGFGVSPMQSNEPSEQVRFTNDYLEALLNKYNGNKELALAAYNAGTGTVDKYGGIPPYKETQNYVKNIMSSINPISEAQASETPYKPTRAEFLAMMQKGEQIVSPVSQKEDKKPTRAEFLAMMQENEPSIGERALKSLPGDIQNIGQSTIDTITHPIDTATKLASIVRGGAQSALPDKAAQWLIDKGVTPESRPDFKALADSYKKDFGSLKGFKEAIATHPATTFLNVTGALSGLQGITRKVAGKSVKTALQKSTEEAAKSNALNAPKAAVLERAKNAGYVMPVSEVNPGFINNRLEGIAGKAALGQQSVLSNQKITSKLARKGLGLSEDKPIDLNTLEKIRKDSGAVYADVSRLPNPPSTANGYNLIPQERIATSKLLEDLKQKRNDSQGWYDAYQRSKSPDDLLKAKTAERESRRLDSEIANRARIAGRNDLRDKLHEARKEIAKSYTVQKGLNTATGEINPVEIGRLYKKGKGKVLTGELKTIGETQQAFPKYMKTGEGAQTPGVSKIEAVTSIGGGGIGAIIGGPLGAAIGAALPLMSTPIRNLLLSKMYQKKFLNIAKKNPSKALDILDKSLSNNISKKTLAGMLYTGENDNENRQTK